MKIAFKVTTTLFIFFLFTLCLPSLHDVLAQNSATSPCVITEIGNANPNTSLPAGCGGGNQDVVALARAQIGKGFYISGTPSRNWASEDPKAGKTPEHFDCSGLAGWAWYWGSGGKVSMEGQTATDWSNGKFKQHKPEEPLQPGDLIYWDTSMVHHTGIYEGAGGCGANDCFIEAYSDGKPVRENSVSKASSYMKMVGFLRPGEQ